MDAPPTQAGSTRAAPPTRRSGCPANPHRRSDLVDDRFRVSRSPRQPAPKELPPTVRQTPDNTALRAGREAVGGHATCDLRHTPTGHTEPPSVRGTKTHTGTRRRAPS